MNNSKCIKPESDTLALLIIFFLVFIVYAWSTSPTVVLEDDGYFIMSAYYLGISHPPGYPLYTLFSHLATYLPSGSIALRVHLLSSLFAALACMLLWKIVYLLCRSKPASSVAAICLAFSGAFWSQAIIAEVYTLNILLILAILYLCLVLTSGNATNNKQNIKWICFLYGLALSNHWPLLVLSTPMFILLLWKKWKFFSRKFLPAIPWLLLGLMPYLWMVLRSQVNPEISFYGPIESFRDFWFYVSRQGYADIDFSPAAGWTDKLAYMRFVLGETVLQFGWFSLPFLLAGLGYIWKKGGPVLFTALCAGFLGSTLLLILFLDFDFDTYHIAIFRVYPIVSYAITAIWIGLGFYVISRYIVNLSHLKLRRTLVIPGLFILLAGTTFSTNLPHNYRGNDFWAEQYAKVVLDSLPGNSVLFLRGDPSVGSIGYLNKIEKYRKDIDLYHVMGQVFNNRLYRPHKTRYGEMVNRVDRFILSTDRDIYYTQSLVHKYGTEDYGLYYGVLKNEDPEFVRSVVTPGLLNYWIKLANGDVPVDKWEKMHYFEILSDGCRVLNNVILHTKEDMETDRFIINTRDNICNHLPGILTRVEQNIQREHPDWPRIESLLQEGGKFLHQGLLKKHYGYYFYYKGLLAVSMNNRSEAEFNFRRSIREWHHPGNPSYREISSLHENP